MIQHANISLIGMEPTSATQYPLGNLELKRIIAICSTFKFELHIQYQDDKGKIDSEIIKLRMNDLISLFQKEGYEFKVPETPQKTLEQNEWEEV